MAENPLQFAAGPIANIALPKLADASSPAPATDSPAEFTPDALNYTPANATPAEQATPFSSGNSDVITTTSGVKAKVNSLNSAINSLSTNSGLSDTTSADFLLGKNTPGGAGGTGVSSSSGSSGSGSNPDAGKQDLSMIAVGTRLDGAQIGLTPGKTYIAQGNGQFATQDPVTGNYSTVGLASSGTTSSGSGDSAIPNAPTYGNFTAEQQKRIDSAGSDAGGQYDTLIANAMDEKNQGLAKAEVSAGERGGFMNTQFAGLSAVLPTQGNSWEGQGGQLNEIKSGYDRTISQLQTQKIAAVNAAKQAMQDYINTGNQKSYENAVSQYNMAVSANKAAIDASNAKVDQLQKWADLQTTLNKPLAAQDKQMQDYAYEQMKKYPSAFTNLTADQLRNITPDQINKAIVGSAEYKNEVLKAHNDAMKAGGSGGGGGGGFTGKISSTAQSYANQILAGNITSIASVPSAYRDQVVAALDNSDPSKYSPLAASRMTMASTRITNQFTNLAGYKLVADGLPYLERIQAANQTPGSVSDQDLLDSLTKLNTGGNAVTDAQVKLITDGKSFSDSVNTWQNKFKNGGVLSDNQRQQITEIANNIYENYKKGYQPIYEQAASQLTDSGIPKAFWTIPDLNTLGDKSQAAMSGAVAVGSIPAVDVSGLTQYTQNAIKDAGAYPDREALIQDIQKHNPGYKVDDIANVVQSIWTDNLKR